MTDDELVLAFEALRPLVTSVIGFHELAEADPPPVPMKLIKYHAQAYAAGHALALGIYHVMDALADRK